MIELKLEIQGRKTEAYQFQLKSSWNELSIPELIALMPTQFYDELTNMNEDMLKQLALFTLCDVDTKEKVKLFKKLTHTDTEQLSILDLYHLTDWLFEPAALEKSLIPEYASYAGPKDEFTKMPIEQYGFADAWYNAYMESKNDEFLDKLCACLYLPKGVAWDKSQVEDWIPGIAKLDLQVKRAMLFNYIGLRNHFVMLYPSIFSNEVKDEDKDALNYEAPEYNPKWFYDLLVNLPADQFGTMKEKAALPVDEVFDYLEYKKNEKLQ